MPKDPYMKSQYVNTMLKANNMDLKTYCTSSGTDMVKLQSKLGQTGISYDSTNHQLKL